MPTRSRAFKDLPLARKALVLGIVPTLCALALVAVASMIATYITARRNLVTDLDTQAAIIAENVNAAVAFQDRASAASTVVAMHARPNIDGVCVFDTAGVLFASFLQRDFTCGASLAADAAIDRTSIVREHAVTAGARRLGTVRIAGNLRQLSAFLWTQSLVIVGAFVGGLLVALALTRRIQRSVSAPVLELAATADAISARRDYRLRATQTTDDEVGGLVRSFNAMLDEIQRSNELLTIEIAERKRAEHLKDEFLAAVSHELRTPLNAVLGWLQILRKTDPSPERVVRALESLERNAQSQARVIEDLLDVSRIVSGKLQVRFDTVDLRDVIAAAVDIISTAAAAKSIEVAVVPPSGPCLVNGDADRLQQVVVNVLANAVKFTPAPGRVTIEVAAERHAPQFAITVTDTGIGIAPQFLEHVFERFRQADGSMTRQHGGLGLGLTIVKEVTELHGGSVEVESRGLGCGATFVIRLPRMTGLEPPSVRTADTAPVPGAHHRTLHGIRVLVADDDVDSLEIAATTLQDAAALVTTAGSGKDAIDAWRVGRFDVLVCDLAMPDLDGFAVLETIQQLDQHAGRTTAAIAVTAYAAVEFKQRSLAAGFQVHLAKPYNTSALTDAVATVVRSAPDPGAGQDAPAEHV